MKYVVTHNQLINQHSYWWFLGGDQPMLACLKELGAPVKGIFLLKAKPGYWIHRWEETATGHILVEFTPESNHEDLKEGA